MSLTPVEPLQWQPDGSPFSPRFGDVYRSRSGGLAQALHVFANGCGLPLAWRGRARWDVLETGFGLGLNFLATWALWRSDPARSPHLRFVSVEAYPVDASALLRSAEALKPHPSTSAAPPEGTRPPPAWDADLIPLVQALAPELVQAWSRLQPGWQSWRLDGGRVELCLGVGDAQSLLDGLPAQAVDAVYLDGFSPAKNPDMWSPALLASVARHAVVGTRLATYTVSSAVRRELTALGFAVRKRAGLPPKRECLHAQMTAAGPTPDGA